MNKSLLTRLFGTDDACGVTFVYDNDPTNRHVSAAENAADIAKLQATGVPHEQWPGAESFLPNGGSGVCCTDYARLVAQRLPGRVQIFGFANEDNPTSRVAREEIHPGGHDFAIVDGRWLVDPWLVLVASEGEQLVFDLEDLHDSRLALDIYGPQSCWKTWPIETHLKHCWVVEPFTPWELCEGHDFQHLSTDAVSGDRFFACKHCGLPRTAKPPKDWK